MRLLNTSTCRLHNFVDSDVPRYAILSHRWGEREVTFAALRDCQMVDDGFSEAAEEEQLFPYLRELRQHRFSKLTSREGWQKVERFCEKARAYGLDWAWIDTACIDKSSSAELQEAINSMFAWYYGAVQCFVYMNDVWANGNWSAREAQFLASEWFKRGWTLQELVAPAFGRRIFFDRDWEIIGLERDLVDAISLVTKIPLGILSEINQQEKIRCLWRSSIAQRMSWAADRQVSRGEDAAYSLLGLFDVNMPLLYGEGKRKAFERLQLEILKKSRDESILAWQKKDVETPSLGALAPVPQCFRHATDLEYMSRIVSPMRHKGIRVTPQGLLVRAVLIDRREKCAATNAILNVKEWTTNFAFPLRVRTLKAQGGLLKTVFVQLAYWKEDEYIRIGDPFLANVDLDELAKHKVPQKFCIRNNTSIAYEIALGIDKVEI